MRNIKDETDKLIVVCVRWLDGLYEDFNAKQIRVSESFLWIRLPNGKNRSIPMRNIRWYSTYPEIHEGAK